MRSVPPDTKKPAAYEAAGFETNPEGHQDHANHTARKATRQEKWQRANRKATWAHQCLRAAIRRGLIERQPCEECGTVETVDGHHDDYDKPMAVRWLCRKHHKQVHKAKEVSA